MTEIRISFTCLLFHRGVRRRDIVFVRRVRGQSCMLLTDESPYPPGAKHPEQHHVGHLTFVWITVELGDDGEKMARVHAYTAGVYFAESTAAKVTLLCFEECMERLMRMSGIMLSAGVLGAGALHSAVSTERRWGGGSGEYVENPNAQHSWGADVCCGMLCYTNPPSSSNIDGCWNNPMVVHGELRGNLRKLPESWLDSGWTPVGPRLDSGWTPAGLRLDPGRTPLGPWLNSGGTLVEPRWDPG